MFGVVVSYLLALMNFAMAFVSNVPLINTIGGITCFVLATLTWRSIRRTKKLQKEMQAAVADALMAMKTRAREAQQGDNDDVRPT